MMRKIITIDTERCNGCGLCASACHEGAIGMINGKAALLREDYCDGLGDCLPVCPTGAISFEEREAMAYNEAEVKKKKDGEKSHLKQWPVQIKLVPVKAPFFQNADLLIAADCTAYAYGAFHENFMKNRVTLIGCPKLDEGDYTDKLTAILRENDINSVTVARMEVPCCGGIERAVMAALANSGKKIPGQTITLTIEGGIIES